MTGREPAAGGTGADEQPGVAGGEADPAEEAAAEDQVGHDSEPQVDDAADRPDRR